MILLTGGRGAVATQLLGLLHEAGLPVRVGSRAPADLNLPADVPAVALDLGDPATFAAALDGVTSVFLYATPDRIGDFVEQALKAGVTHVVLLSSSAVLGAGAAADPLAKSHLDVESALLASPLATTILRPGSFASNAAVWAWPVKAGRPVSLPFPGAHSDPVHERDIAEAAFAVLTDPRHRGGCFTLTGPESLTFTEQIDQLAEVVATAITVKHVTRAEWKREMADYIPGAYADALLDWWESHDGKPVTTTRTVESLTGGPARPFSVWAADHAADFTRS
ncbi:SDR family oxidoreductase [Streptomyces silvensis]|uniref:NmrA family transcriptional regulator n=1 Tax=Streptomyces silvensis TaxID=1765722 RepID=A0A0W7X828_9ACTN|nr:NAD(P)H-binding protein [Streptomyces silvensis]KUF18945.1 NmrA family transcriptional regulator [Streptomyces silvensis]